MKTPLLLLFLFCTFSAFAGAKDDTVIVRRGMTALRTSIAPKINGELNDEAWKNATATGDFIQNSPVEKAAVSFPTEVRIVYDDNAIYVGAMLYDNPDSIKKQLGLRDDVLNADNFQVKFDTYKKQQDAFCFSVTASGVQSDSRISDAAFNAVWHSAVKILPNGWSVEMEIPWSALRFPSSNEQKWGLQMTRNIQRKFEFDQWALTPKGNPNPMKFWGILDGLNNIKAPIRLSLTPYLSTVVEKDSRFGPVEHPSASIGGGLGLKYGINESFTLDMTLLPDFSQVKSDNLTKNLSPFEIQFDEQRPFFTEGTDLFSRGDIFYSRRIGRTPTQYYNLSDLTTTNEKIIKNPGLSKLLNATKLSGRTNKGLGIGILNAFVDNTYAIAQDTLTGMKRKILTEPSSNYNIIVFDQQLKNSSNVYVSNTNVMRSHGYRSANVTAAGFSLNNKKSSWNVNGVGGISDVMQPGTLSEHANTSVGYYYHVGLGKNSGKVQYFLNRQVVNRKWDCNDMGINNETNYANSSADISYNIYNPWKFLNNGYFDFAVNYTSNLATHERNSLQLDPYANVTFKNFWTAYLGGEWTPFDSKDYYEPREDGRYYLRTRYKDIYGGVNSNENKKLSGGIGFHAGSTAKITATIPANPWGGGEVFLTWRVGNRFVLTVDGSFHGDFGDRGWVAEEPDSTIVFGRRIIHSFENSIFASFVFVKDMSVSVQGRHFWETGHYRGYYVLQEDGTLMDYLNYGGDHDFSYNSFNVDLVYNWIFAPGSTLSIAWKQNILNEETMINYSYTDNFGNTIRGPQLNQVSVRVLYYLDYNYLRNRRK